MYLGIYYLKRSLPLMSLCTECMISNTYLSKRLHNTRAKMQKELSFPFIYQTTKVMVLK